MQKDINKFIKIILIFCIPFIMLCLSYFYFDPFKVLYSYDDYYADFFIEPNRDFVSVEKYFKYKDSQNYTSYIFGSSRLMAWTTDSWGKYIDDKNIYHFDAYKDNLYGVWCKINLIDRVGEGLKNVLLVIEYDLLTDVSDSTSRLFMKHHIYSDKSKFEFHNFYFQEYLAANFYFEFFDYKIFRKRRSYMKQIDLNNKHSSQYSNNYYISNLDESLKNSPEKYYSRQKFYEHDSVQLFYPECINEIQIKYLTDIKKIFDKYSTNYKIVISPLYDQKKMDSSDYQKLDEIFGKDNIYDFSGINEITKVKENYYDIYHYRPHVADFILDSIY